MCVVVAAGVRTVAESAGKVWNLENVRKGAAVRRAVREADKSGWILSPILSSITSGASIVTHVRTRGE